MAVPQRSTSRVTWMSQGVNDLDPLKKRQVFMDGRKPAQAGPIFRADANRRTPRTADGRGVGG
jgi:hypothetical protein